VQVCQAVQHAHQKGIIHRDLKPSNILVAENDGVAVPRVIDFGIAKATQMELTDKTLFTRFHQFIGTPAYISPEQAGVTNVDIDTRSDIYSLGVLLYELLTGKTPFDAKELLGAGLDEMRRTIREKEPTRPSLCLKALPDVELTTTANRRGLDASKLIGQLRGDLDWIVVKCLEKDRARRYETANELAMDVARHVKNEPVVARPPSALYEFQKTIRRHKLSFMAATAILVALVLGMSVAIWGLFRERQARAVAQTEAAKSRQAARFLEEMLGSVSPDVAAGLDTTLLKKILDQTASRISVELKGQPEVEAEVRTTIGWVYGRLEQFGKAEEMYTNALNIYDGLEKHDLSYATTLEGMGLLLQRKGQRTDAESMLRNALALRQKLGGETFELATTKRFLGLVMVGQARYQEAGVLFDDALRIQGRFPGRRKEMAETLINISDLLYRTGARGEGEARLQEAIDILKTLGTDQPAYAYAMGMLSKYQRREGKLSEAEASAREEIRLYTRLGIIDEDGPGTLAAALKAQHRWEEAEIAGIEAVTAGKKIAPGRIQVARNLSHVVNCSFAQGKIAEAEPWVREELAIRKKREPGTLEVFRAEDNLGRALAAQKRYEEAEPLLISGYEGMKKQISKSQDVSDDAYSMVSTAWKNILTFYQTGGKSAEIARWRTDFVSWIHSVGSKCHSCQNELGWFLATCTNADARDGSAAVGFAENAVLQTNRKNADYLNTLAAAYAEAGDFAKAGIVQKEAMVLLHSEKEKQDFGSRLTLYESNKPYHESR
jgi:tetratricopeptide (TPR) repeat protein